MNKLKSSLLLVVLTVFLFAGCATTSNKETQKSLPKSFAVEKLNSKMVPVYAGEMPDPIAQAEIQIPVNKSTKQEMIEIPYVNVAEYLSLWNSLEFGEERNAKTEKISSTKIKLFRTELNTFEIIFDSKEQKIYFRDYDAAMRESDDKPLLSVLSAGTKKYIKNTGNNFNRYGKFITVDLGKYGIKMVIKDDAVYIPLSTFCTLFKAQLAYNKSGLFLNHSTVTRNFFDENSGKNDRSEELKYFNYRDLCFTLDFIYGLKETHEISDFHSYFCETGLIEKFLGDAENSTEGIFELTTNYLADYHSGLNIPSYYCGSTQLETGKPYAPEGFVYNPIYVNYSRLRNQNNAIRQSVWEEKKYNVHVSPTTKTVTDYYVVGDTAFITFDTFYVQSDVDYYALTENGTKELEYDKVCDTLGLVIYAHQQIKKNPAIKNVVIDDSLNGGGMADALIYIESWILGETPFSAKNVMSGDMCTASYVSDVNLDGEFTAEDSLPGLGRNLKLFCVTSPMSFSCGNGLPAVLKESGKVTMLGMRSGGGACVVRFLNTADSVKYQVSGPIQLCTVKNGAYYQIDQGVEPDYAITDLRVIYDREELASLIKHRVLYSK